MTPNHSTAGAHIPPSDELSSEDLRMIDRAWETHKAALPIATVIDDNQPGRTAIIRIDVEPPTIQVGTLLYGQPKAVGAERELALQNALEAVAGTEVTSVRTDALVKTINAMRDIARAALKSAGGE